MRGRTHTRRLWDGKSHTCLPFGSGRALDAGHACYPGKADFAHCSFLPEEALQPWKHRVLLEAGEALHPWGPALAGLRGTP